MIPVSEIQTRVLKLVEVRERIDDSQAKLTSYIERVDELVAWASRECDTLAEQVALHQADKAIKK